MNSLTEVELTEIFNRLPILSGFHLDDFEIIPLAGLSNKNYRIKNNHVDWILRIPRPVLNPYIDRKNEAFNSEIAVQLGLSPDCIWRNEKGESLTQFVPQSKPISCSDLKNKEVIKLIAQRLNHLHNSDQCFKGQVNLEQLLQQYFQLLTADDQQQLHPRFATALSKLELLQTEQHKLVPSHNDLNEANLLLDSFNNLWFIDWEYSSMASPYWDLATICNSADYTLTERNLLLQYYGTDRFQLEMNKLQDYQQVLSVLNDCWNCLFN